ncbi:LapA family protein [Vibrio zhugei]|uniref:Probable lipopolysaccharide assembly protein A n=1 Tax=Vibrio zhugei TaxID=2479546 RepID=A0ABV7C5Y8_9VIBR|nr:lipopolysaccharide assembly protein LapA domain-containing protein [Vibrio zhugei]
MKIIKGILILVLFLIALAMGAQNQAVVTFNYLLAQGQFHLSTLLGSVFLVGFLLAWGMCYGFYFKSKVTIRKLNKQLKKHNANNDVSNEN